MTEWFFCSNNLLGLMYIKHLQGEIENVSALTEECLGLYLVNWGEDWTLEVIF